MNWKPFEGNAKKPGSLYTLMIEKIKRWRSGNPPPADNLPLLSADTILNTEFDVPSTGNVVATISIPPLPAVSPLINKEFGVESEDGQMQSITNFNVGETTLSTNQSCVSNNASSDKLDEILKIVKSNSKKIASVELTQTNFVNFVTIQLVDIIAKLIGLNDHLSNIYELINTNGIKTRVPAKNGNQPNKFQLDNQNSTNNQTIIKITKIKSF